MPSAEFGLPFRTTKHDTPAREAREAHSAPQRPPRACLAAGGTPGSAKRRRRSGQTRSGPSTKTPRTRASPDTQIPESARKNYYQDARQLTQCTHTSCYW